MPKPPKPFLDLRSPSNPWIYFLVFSLCNTLLAYTSWSLVGKLFIGFYGLLAPTVLFLWAQQGESSRGRPRPGLIFNPSVLSDPTVVGLFASGVLLLVTRFWGIGSNPLWPIKDVGHFGILGLSLAQKWDGRLLWGEFQCEPLYLWGLGLFFKLVGPSSFSTRVFPALFSLLDLGLAYWAARQFFSRAFSLMAVLLFVEGFAVWVFSRTGYGPVALWPVEFLVLGLLGKAVKDGAKLWVYPALGLAAGIGFYAYTSWVVVFMAVLVALIWKSSKIRLPFLSLFLFLISTAAVSLPMIETRLGQGGFHHLQSEFSPSSFLNSFLGYLSLLFWNGLGSYPDGPAWGGVLNPLEGALALLGFLRMAARKPRLGVGFSLAFGLFLSPGVFSNTLAMDHVIQVFPLMVIPLLSGVEGLLDRLNPANRWRVGGILLALFATLNAYHWWGPYQDWKSIPSGKSDWISGEYARAYGLLSRIGKGEGPGYLFTEFHLDSFDKTLELFCYPFDALQNPKWRWSRPRWAALVVNKYYVPFLQKRFPQSHWDILKKDTLPNNLNLALGLIPLDASLKEDWDRWKAADQAWRNLDLEMKKAGPLTGMDTFQNQWRSQHSLFVDDPFLCSVYWERMAMFDAIRGDLTACEGDFKQALQEGYPAAHLYYNLSIAEREDGRLREADQDLRMAEELQGTPSFPAR